MCRLCFKNRNMLLKSERDKTKEFPWKETTISSAYVSSTLRNPFSRIDEILPRMNKSSDELSRHEETNLQSASRAN